MTMWDTDTMERINARERAAHRSELDTRDNRTTLAAAIAAGDDVEFSSTGRTLWRVDPGDGYGPRHIARLFGINLSR